MLAFALRGAEDCSSTLADASARFGGILSPLLKMNIDGVASRRTSRERMHASGSPTKMSVFIASGSETRLASLTITSRAFGRVARGTKCSSGIRDNYQFPSICTQDQRKLNVSRTTVLSMSITR